MRHPSRRKPAVVASSSSAPPDTAPPERVHFRDDGFEDLVRTMARKYPDQWVALAEEPDERAGGICAIVLEHHAALSETMRAAVAFHDRHPDASVHLFSTETVAAGRVRY